jgi:cytidylate kinase
MVVGTYEKCKQYIESHYGEEFISLQKKHKEYPSITISRETGAGSQIVCEKLIEILDDYSTPENIKWTYFDRHLIEKILEDHNLPEQIKNYMLEGKYHYIGSTVYELLGLAPSQWTIIHRTTDTILQLARMGGAVIVGRGANVIAAKLKNTFHVRLVAPLEKRIDHICEITGMNEKEAGNHIKKHDQNRTDYIKSYFGKNIEDPLLYHMILNTGYLGHETAAKVIAESVISNHSILFPQFA